MIILIQDNSKKCRVTDQDIFFYSPANFTFYPFSNNIF